MRRNNLKSFFGQKQMIAAIVIVAAAAALMTGFYMTGRNGDNGRTAEISETEMEDTEQPVPASAVIEPKEKAEPEDGTNADGKGADGNRDSGAADGTGTDGQAGATLAEGMTAEETAADGTKSVETAAKAASGETAVNLHFSADSDLLWPLNGSVIMSYNMDQTVYFATLQQYKYNPAVVIAGNVGDEVVCAADGIVKEVRQDAETGCTVVMDIGDGYSAIYGQLKDVPYNAGAYVTMGETLGYVEEPSKYYSVEGSNLYFKLEKDGEPVDPILFFE